MTERTAIDTPDLDSLLQLTAAPDTSKADRLARTALDPLANAASAVPCFTNAVAGFELRFGALVCVVLRSRIRRGRAVGR